MRWILAIFVLGVLSSCKNAPNQAFNNPVDPESDSFEPATPTNLTVYIRNINYSNPNNMLMLNWDVPLNEKYINLFKIYRSDSDTTDFHEVGTVSFSSRNRDHIGNKRRYQFTDKQGYNGIKVWYKVTAYYTRNRGTISSESSPVLYNQNVLQISASLTPFSADPAVNLQWSYLNLNNNVDLRIYSKAPQSSDYTFISSLKKKDQSAQLPLDLHQNNNTKFYYKLVHNELETAFIQIPTTTSKPKLSILDSPTFTDSKANFHIGFEPDSYTGIITMDDYTVKLFNVLPGDTSLVFETQATFATPYTSVSFNGLQKEIKYYLTIQGNHGNYETQTLKRFLNYHPIINSQTTYNFTITDSYFPSIGLNNSETQVIIANNEKNPIFVDLKNQVAHSPIQLDIDDYNNISEIITSQFGDYGPLSDAVITSNSNDRVQIWNPLNFNFEHEIPNFKEGVSGVTPAYPIGFDVISKDEMVIAYAHTSDLASEETGKVTLTLWDNRTQTHEILHSFSYSGMYMDKFKIAYQNDLIGIAFSHNSETELVTINKTDHSIIQQTNIPKHLNNWSFIDLTFGNNGNDLIVFTNKDITRYQSSTHAFTDRFNVGHSTDWFGLRGFTSAKNTTLFCYGGVGKNSHTTDIICAETLYRYNVWIRAAEEGSLVGLYLNGSGEKLVAIFRYKVMVFDLTPGWVLE